jgi:hypothetical protein
MVNRKVTFPQTLMSTFQLTVVAVAFFFIAGRVTKLGEISPIMRLFSSVSCLKMAKDFHVSELLWYTEKLGINMGKNELGNILGEFFHKLIWSP